MGFNPQPKTTVQLYFPPSKKIRKKKKLKINKKKMPFHLYRCTFLHLKKEFLLYNNMQGKSKFFDLFHFPLPGSLQQGHRPPWLLSLPSASNICGMVVKN